MDLVEQLQDVRRQTAQRTNDMWSSLSRIHQDEQSFKGCAGCFSGSSFPGRYHCRTGAVFPVAGCGDDFAFGEHGGVFGGFYLNLRFQFGTSR